MPWRWLDVPLSKRGSLRLSTLRATGLRQVVGRHLRSRLHRGAHLLSATAQFATKTPTSRHLPELELSSAHPVELRAEFFELPAAKFDPLSPTRKRLQDIWPTFAPADAAQFRQKLDISGSQNLLEKVPGLTEGKLLGAPHVTATDGQSAVIEIIRERQVLGAQGYSKHTTKGLRWK